MINKKGFSVRHDRSIRCPLCYFIGESMQSMSEHFRTHLTEQTHREHVREALRTTKLLECEDCKIRFMKMEDLRVAHDNIKNLDKSKYDIDAIRPRLENCNLFKNYEFFIRNIEPPSQAPIEVVGVESGTLGTPPADHPAADDPMQDSDDEPILVKIKKAENSKSATPTPTTPTPAFAPVEVPEPATIKLQVVKTVVVKNNTTVTKTVEEVRIVPPVLVAKSSAPTPEPPANDPPSFSQSDTDDPVDADIGGIVTNLDETIDKPKSPEVVPEPEPAVAPEVVSVSSVKVASPKKTSRRSSRGVTSNMPLFPCPSNGCTENPFKSFAKMDEHFRITHATSEYTEFRRGPYDLIKMTQTCDDCGFHFPSEEEYFDHFAFCTFYKLESAGGRRKRRSVKSLEEPKAKAAKIDEPEVDMEPDNEPDYENDGEKDSDSSEDFSGEDEDFEPSGVSAPPPPRPTRASKPLPVIPEEKSSSENVARAPPVRRPPRISQTTISGKTNSMTHLYDKELEQPNGLGGDRPNDSEIRQNILDDHCFCCFWKDCDYKNTFKNILCHFRESHGQGYLIYRVRMLSIYGIMARRCGDCNFQFLTTLSYDHHKQNRRCDIYKEIEMPSKEKQLQIINNMRPKLVRTTMNDSENNIIQKPNESVNTPAVENNATENGENNTASDSNEAENASEVENGVSDPAAENERDPEVPGDDAESAEPDKQSDIENGTTEPAEKEVDQVTNSGPETGDGAKSEEETESAANDDPIESEAHEEAENPAEEHDNNEMEAKDSASSSTNSSPVPDEDAVDDDDMVVDKPPITEELSNENAPMEEDATECEENQVTGVLDMIIEGTSENADDATCESAGPPADGEDIAEQDVNQQENDGSENQDDVEDPADVTETGTVENDDRVEELTENVMDSIDDDELDIPDEPGSSDVELENDAKPCSKILPSSSDPTMPCTASPDKSIIAKFRPMSTTSDGRLPSVDLSEFNQNQNSNNDDDTCTENDILNSAQDVLHHTASGSMPDLTEIDSFLHNDDVDLSPK